jgi:hypothetical protein
MITIKAIYDKLTPEERRLLNYALETQVGQFVRLSDSRYIGVHVNHIKNLRPEILVGAWAYGRINE